MRHDGRYEFSRHTTSFQKCRMLPTQYSAFLMFPRLKFRSNCVPLIWAALISPLCPSPKNRLGTFLVPFFFFKIVFPYSAAPCIGDAIFSKLYGSPLFLDVVYTYPLKRLNKISSDTPSLIFSIFLTAILCISLDFNALLTSLFFDFLAFSFSNLSCSRFFFAAAFFFSDPFSFVPIY